MLSPSATETMMPVMSLAHTPKENMAMESNKRICGMIERMSDVICLCNGVWEEDLIEYLQKYPVESIEELRSKERICNNCRQCEPLIQDLIERYKGNVNP